jgi:hypothetical protein
VTLKRQFMDDAQRNNRDANVPTISGEEWYAPPGAHPPTPTWRFAGAVDGVGVGAGAGTHAPQETRIFEHHPPALNPRGSARFPARTLYAPPAWIHENKSFVLISRGLLKLWCCPVFARISPLGSQSMGHIIS